MLTILCVILFVWVFGSILKFALKAAWGLTKLTLGLVFLPVVIFVFLFFGLLVLALPTLILLGLLVLVKNAAAKA